MAPPSAMPTDAVVTALVLDGASVVLAATTTGLFRSVDAGRSWTRTGSVLPFEALAMAPGAAEEGALFAVVSGELARSRDSGATWEAILVDGPVLAVAAASDAVGSAIVLAGTERDGALRSADGGSSWASANPGLLDLSVLALALSPHFAGDKTGFAGTASGLYRTRNGGRAWRALELPVDDPAVQCLALSPAFASNRAVLAGTEADGLLRSDDEGRTWEIVPALAEGGVVAVALGDEGRAAAATDEGVAISGDAGATWRMVEHCQGPALSLAFVSSDDAADTLLVGLASGGLVRIEIA